MTFYKNLVNSVSKELIFSALMLSMIPCVCTSVFLEKTKHVLGLCLFDHFFSNGMEKSRLSQMSPGRLSHSYC